MLKYKTVVTDYEGMQSTLDTHSEQGWKLFSVTPDTFRRSVASPEDAATAAFSELSASVPGTVEYSTSYYLLVFCSEQRLELEEMALEAEAQLPQSPLQFLQD